MQVEKKEEEDNVKEKLKLKIESIRDGTHIQEIVKKSSLMLKMSDKDMLRKLYLNIGKAQFVELLELTVEQYLLKKQTHKRLSIGHLFIKQVNDKLNRNQSNNIPNKNSILNRNTGLVKKSKRIKKNENKSQLVVQKKNKIVNNTVKNIQKKNKTNNVFDNLPQFSEEDEM